MDQAKNQIDLIGHFSRQSSFSGLFPGLVLVTWQFDFASLRIARS
jgi:hypothetical protein